MMKALIVGDSHAKYFGVTPQVKTLVPSLSGVDVQLEELRGATISGFGKRESTLNAKRVVTDLLEAQSPDVAILNFGQVDLELGLPFRQFVREDEVSVERHLVRFVETYQDFVSSLGSGRPRVVVKGCNLPVLCRDRRKALHYTRRIISENVSDPQEQAAVLARMRRDFPDDTARTAITEQFNGMLEGAMDGVGAAYFDLNERLRDPATGLVAAEFIPSGRDHHLVDSITVRAMHWEEALAAVCGPNRRKRRPRIFSWRR